MRGRGRKDEFNDYNDGCFNLTVVVALLVVVLGALGLTALSVVVDVQSDPCSWSPAVHAQRARMDGSEPWMCVPASADGAGK